MFLILFLWKIFLDVLLWWFNGGATPVLIPNTEVKSASGDGSLLNREARVANRQSKAPKKKNPA